MDKNKEMIIRQMLYDKDKEEVLKELYDINDSEVLYLYAYNYNWYNGFEIPRNILLKDCCELSTALMIFYTGDGVRYLQDKNEDNGNLKEWSIFIRELYAKIVDNEFSKGNIKFIPPLSKVQIFKLKKMITDKESIFLQEFGSYDLKITL
jgi:hypothetical protein